MATTVQQDITAISGYAGQYSNQIITSVVNGLDIANDLKIIRNLKSPKSLPKYKANEGFRPVNTSIEEPARLQGKFSTRKLTPRVGMKILKIVPEELRDTYLSEDLAPNAKEYPGGFAQYFWEEQIKVLQAEINNNSYFGIDSQDVPVFDNTLTYAVGKRVNYLDAFYEAVLATSAGDSPITAPLKWRDVNNASVAKGLGTIIAEEYANLPARNKIATGVLDQTNAFDKITAFYMSLPDEVRGLGGTIEVSQATYDKYNMSLLNKFTNGTSFMQVIDAAGKAVGMYVFGSDGKWAIKPRTWMAGSGRIIANVADANLHMGTDQTSDFNTLGNIVPFLHGYRAIMKMILAFQVADIELLFVNDQK